MAEHLDLDVSAASHGADKGRQKIVRRIPAENKSQYAGGFIP